MNAEYSLIFHLHNFKNIDLQSQGIYRLRVSIISSSNDVEIEPEGFFDAPSTTYHSIRNKCLKNVPIMNLEGSRLCEDSDCFYTRSFVLRFHNEKLELNSGIKCKLGVKVTTSSGLIFANSSFKIKVELLFCPLLLESPSYANNNVGPSSSSSSWDKEIPSKKEFECLISEFVEVPHFGPRLHWYIPLLMFKMPHSAFLESSIHLCLTNLDVGSEDDYLLVDEENQEVKEIESEFSVLSDESVQRCVKRSLNCLHESLSWILTLQDVKNEEENEKKKLGDKLAMGYGKKEENEEDEDSILRDRESSLSFEGFGSVHSKLLAIWNQVS